MRRRREREGGGETRREEEKNRRGREDCWHDHTGIPQCKQARLCQAKKTLGFTEYCDSFIANRYKDKKPSHSSKTTLIHALVFVDCGSLFFSDRVCPTCQPGWVFSLPLSSPLLPAAGKGEIAGRKRGGKGRPEYVSAVVCTCVAGVGRGEGGGLPD